MAADELGRLRELVDRRAKHLARAAPLGEEVDEERAAVRARRCDERGEAVRRDVFVDLAAHR